MNPPLKLAWFHCGNCGSLFESERGRDKSRVCTACGKVPGTGMWPVLAEAVTTTVTARSGPNSGEAPGKSASP